MNFSNRILQVTQDAIQPFVIESILGKFAARQYKAWRDSKEYATALHEAFAMNYRTTGKLPLTDKRTRGHKHLNAAFEKFAAQYAKEHPELPEERRVNIFGKLSGIKPV